MRWVWRRRVKFPIPIVGRIFVRVNGSAWTKNKYNIYFSINRFNIIHGGILFLVMRLNGNRESTRNYTLVTQKNTTSCVSQCCCIQKDLVLCKLRPRRYGFFSSIMEPMDWTNNDRHRVLMGLYFSSWLTNSERESHLEYSCCSSGKAEISYQYHNVRH